MVTIEQAIYDMRNHIKFKDDGESCTTEGEVIILLDRQNSMVTKLESDKRKLADFIINNWHSCPISAHVNCKHQFQQEGCAECLLHNINALNLS